MNKIRKKGPERKMSPKPHSKCPSWSLSIWYLLTFCCWFKSNLIPKLLLVEDVLVFFYLILMLLPTNMWLGLDWIGLRYLRIASVFEKLEILLFSFRSVSHQIDNQPWENCNGNITGQRTRMQCSNPMLENPKGYR